MRIILSGILLGLYGTLMMSCGTTTTPPVQANFTRADSLTDRYLSLHDSIHQIWNIMINDDNHKLEAMHHLVHELIVSNPEEIENLKSVEERLNHLLRIRYTQKSMSNADVVSEYDLASNALILELLANTETKQEYSYNKTLQKLVREIRNAETRAYSYRTKYDSVANAYNYFIDRNRESLFSADENLLLEKKPLFQIVAEE